jgi:hypothetical protein
VRSTLYLHQLALAAVAALGVVAALAVVAIRHPPRSSLPAAVGSYAARAGVVGARASGCGLRIGPASEGIENPVLPCGMRLYVSYRGRTVLASVIAHEPIPSGREFGLTPRLAARLGLSGVGAVRWSYAASAP